MTNEMYLTNNEKIEMLCLWRLSDLSKACRHYRDFNKGFIISDLNRTLHNLSQLEKYTK